jgi:hypothetical protein
LRKGWEQRGRTASCGALGQRLKPRVRSVRLIAARDRAEVVLSSDTLKGLRSKPARLMRYPVSLLRRVLLQVRVVILGQDPYINQGEAMGLSFSVPPGEEMARACPCDVKNAAVRQQVSG